ncbi:conserved membrane protein of unknown function [Ruminococcaceae bacterium BL-6]|nr:conserved membrane protein of unknown function [Ruminococcaceae bacterium BL-6]
MPLCGVTAVIKTFAISFRLRNAYKTNGIIYALKSIPLVNKMLPSALYASSGLKSFANILSILFEIVSAFAGKALYLLLMIVLPLYWMKASGPSSFLHALFFLTLAGGLLNSHLFSPSRDKYYAMFLMRMDARKYALSDYLYFLLKTAAGFLLLSFVFGTFVGLGAFTCLLIPIFICGIKLIMAAVTLYHCRDGEKVYNESLPPAIIWAGTALALIAAYLLPFLGYVMSETLFLALCATAIFAAVPCFVYIWRFKKYRMVYRTLLTSNNLAMNTVDVHQITQESYRKKIETDLNQTSRKSGYSYFNELFIKRHSKMLTKAAKKITLVLIALLTIAIAVCFAIPDGKARVNELILTYLPFSLILMYFINRGRAITAAMFMNCDHSMLAYRFYRQPKAILALFTERLKSISIINFMPASVLALGLAFLLFFSGGTQNPLNYVVIVLSIFAMSVFFSVHTLVLYYLLQPYNANMEIKNPIYEIINTITYLVCYFAAGKAVSTLVFGIGVTLFCILYVATALVLAYRLAPKTFKLRQ